MEVFIAIGVVFALLVVLSIALRKVVPTNMVHIVQSKKKVISYGQSKEGGNVYWAWPSWVPLFGVLVTRLPVNNFEIKLESYDSYDRDRVPFLIDVTAFFRITDTNKAAQNIEYKVLENQLRQIVQGAVRTILASYTIDEIMMQRDTFSDSFTSAVTEQLKEWGVAPVKNLELMDIRDAKSSSVIENIMAKKKSYIERESRVEVAENMRVAEEAEIKATQEIDLKRVAAQQVVGERTAASEQAVGIALEQSKQFVAAEAAVTAEKEMEVVKVNTIMQAKINREQAEIEAKEAEFKAEAILKEGQAEAEVRKKIYEADNALEIRLTVQKETAIGVAQALASGKNALVPETFIGGGGDGKNGEPSSAVDTLLKLITASTATQMTAKETTTNNTSF
jgi:flotillin